ncbi:PH domain-containing protein DDB_G0275795 [Drosophila hydei]|uniref:PH domain-containing protein DDB_G0275795 n=1 Tax=Drosophila hydei TaxID=7224 RepID=A0A6J1LPI7_DROHY|nr:PH domain-containing protein DDB_G0275795 [Drosophila hydei]
MAKLGEAKIPITEFLDAYRRQPCLYNSLLDTYKNRGAREDAYEAIIRTLKIPQLTVLDIKLKIKSVRTVYTKELRILMREKELGRCYEPKLFWFKRADAFLRAVSLSHYKRTKNKDSDVPIKKEIPQKLLLNAASQIVEDAVQQQQDDHHEDELESIGQMDDAYHTDVDEHVKTTMSTGTNTNILPNASSQTDDLQSVCSSTRTPPNKSELIIDDSQLSIMEQQQQQQQLQQQQQHQQQQQQQTLPRKLKYMTYGQNHQQQPQRLATPFPSPSPSQHLELATNGNPNLSFTGGDDDLYAFGQSIASQLRSIVDPYARSVAKLRIQQVLFEAETGQSSETVSTTHLHNF